MKKALSFISIILFCLGQQSCTPPAAEENPGPTPYTFFVAGHAYGHPRIADTLPGLYPPFADLLPQVVQDSSVDFGILTGDVVKRSDTARWDSVFADLKSISIPLFIAPGNHENDGIPQHEQRFGHGLPHSFIRESDLFLILDPEDQGWDIPGNQIQFVKDKIAESDSIRNIFVFFHQVLWYAPGEEHFHRWARPNNVEERGDTVNFWGALDAPLRETGKPVYYFAGDVGAWCSGSEVRSHTDGNMHYLASGMGCDILSNFLLVKVSDTIEIDIISLSTPERDGLGTIKKFAY